ncbi:hypothetical protein [Streptomyces sp. NPDC094032]|uniref:hypothetical protein n=1 Tax=Streptomyces sp. NPDC094032 TaxID=3155308 RepID=UPI003319D5E0
MIEKPEDVAGVKACPGVVRGGGGAEPVAQVLAVDRSCDANVLAVLAAVGPLDDDLDIG